MSTRRSHLLVELRRTSLSHQVITRFQLPTPSLAWHSCMRRCLRSTLPIDVRYFTARLEILTLKLGEWVPPQSSSSSPAEFQITRSLSVEFGTILRFCFLRIREKRSSLSSSVDLPFRKNA
ncbi:hypothetical protein TNCV_2968751 [Trichonephila clavipes]|nr:hypothetical protein TNCV_2968751 [Trichonephila clavipes]